jgi:hypothetical protein
MSCAYMNNIGIYKFTRREGCMLSVMMEEYWKWLEGKKTKLQRLDMAPPVSAFPYASFR